MTIDLTVLANKRDELLLAEVAAWLHDMGKCSDEMIERQASDKPQQPIFRGRNDYKTHFSHLLGSKANCCIVLNGENVTLKDLTVVPNTPTSEYIYTL